MNKISLRQILIPLLAVGIIFFLWFGPLQLAYLTNIIATLVVLVASYAEHKGNGLTELGFQRDKFTLKNIFVLAPLVALGLFLLYAFVLVPVITKITGVPIDYSAFDEIRGNLKVYLFSVFVVWLGSGFGEEIIFTIK